MIFWRYSFIKKTPDRETWKVDGSVQQLNVASLIFINKRVIDVAHETPVLREYAGK